MKKIIKPFCLIFVLAVYVPITFAEQNEPTLQETTTFLSKYLNFNDRCSYEHVVGRAKSTVKQNVSFVGCKMHVNLETYNYTPSGDTGYVNFHGDENSNDASYTLDFHSVNNVVFEYKQSISGYDCGNSSTQFPRFDIILDEKSTPVSISGESYMLREGEKKVVVFAKDEAYRVKKALRHLIKLCGGEAMKDPDDLFR